ncbi:multiple epidermal growth factor-like domains protein 8 [Glandiceps talaboti]
MLSRTKCRWKNTQIWRQRTFIYSIVYVHVLLELIIGVGATCNGRTVFVDTWSGEISDGNANYPEDSYCEWRIIAPDPQAKIVLKFSDFETECTYDFLFIYDGNSYDSPLIASFSGNTVPETVVAYSGAMIIYLYSDTNYARAGVEATFEIENCTYGCSGEGSCIDYECLCNSNWKGDACQFQSCPDSCGMDENHGRCNNFLSPRRCQCENGYIGESCTLSTWDNIGADSMHLLSSGFDFTARTAHAAVYLQPSNRFWVFAGFTVHSVLDDLMYFDFESNQWISVTPLSTDKPSGRYSHTMVGYQDSLVVFGGVLEDNTLSNHLWLFNTTTLHWIRLAESSLFHPPGLGDHTACLVDDQYLYIFGGHSSSAHFTSKMYRYNLHLPDTDWEKVEYRGGMISGLAVTGHSMVYHPESRSLVVYGGYKPQFARNSARSDHLMAFHVDYLYWAMWEYTAKDDDDVPSDRALHSANIMGNYMVVYGGNTHAHQTNEKCYDDDIYYYHLGCHKWVDKADVTNDFTGQVHHDPGRGRFGHATAVRDGSTLLISGGYNGVARIDLIAYKVPLPIAVNSNISKFSETTSQCFIHISENSCRLDPECGWCSQGSQNCLHYSDADSCTGTFQRTECPGVCSVLSDCKACLIWGSGVTTTTGVMLNEQCGWCVQDAKCYARNDVEGQCGENSSPGWWGNNGTLIKEFYKCRTQDVTAGITWIKYREPQDLSQPDEVSIVPTTNNIVRFKAIPGSEIKLGGHNIVVYKGFILPMEATPSSDHEEIKMWMWSQSIATLWLSTDDTEENKEQVAYDTVNNERFTEAERPDKVTPLFPDTSKGVSYYVEFEAKKTASDQTISSEMMLNWNVDLKRQTDTHQAITSPYLRPYYSGSCTQYSNCLACMTDASCGWCPTSQRCILRTDTNGDAANCDKDTADYLITNASHCTVCSLYQACAVCTGDPLCEWLSNDARCVRRGRFSSDDFNVMSYPSNCSLPCHQKTSCSECTGEWSECAWCESAQSCFAFSSYISRYTYGQCSHWFDSTGDKECVNCSAFRTCGECLTTFQCGWCGNTNNPNIGICYDGDYSGPNSPSSCQQLIAVEHGVSEIADWSYDVCPDVAECRLGLDDCHHNATCINTHESFTCECNRGFTGDGKLFCNETCYYDCVYGECSGPPNFVCECDIGWTDPDCNTNCGCYNHSTCGLGVGICDDCQHWTEGQFCESCQPGSHGNATTIMGCEECECNGHGDPSRDNCDIYSGICHCIDNTQGDHCEECVDGYYGNPRDNGKCYQLCEGRAVITDAVSSAIGSEEGQGVTDVNHVYCLWIISVFDNITSPSPLTVIPSISLTIEDTIQIECQNDHVYVYDGVPESISGVADQSESVLLGAFCGQGLMEPITVAATSGIMTVVFEGNVSRGAISKHFTASYVVNRCPAECTGNRECQGNECICSDNYRGVDCSAEVCPDDCNGQGTCHQDLGMCVCNEGYGGSACQLSVADYNVVWKTLYDPWLQVNANNSYQPLSRIGHSMVAVDNELWVYGGYSLTHGIMGDVYRYDIPSKQWASTSTTDGGVQPLPRYFHAAAYTSPQTMFIHGGITTNGVAKDLWLLNLDDVEWTKVEIPAQFPAIAGHSMTLVMDQFFVIIGGYSPHDGLSNIVIQYTIDESQWTVLAVTGTPPIGLFGHTTSWHPETHSLYIFGGYVFQTDSISPSNQLYAFHYTTRHWSLLSAAPFPQPPTHFLHVSMATPQYLVVLSGATEEYDFASSVFLYLFECNTWISLDTDDISTIGEPMKPSIGSTAAVIATKPYHNIYIMGGFDGTTHGALYQLTLPDDLCTLYTTVESCLATIGCSACTAFNDFNGINRTYCYNASTSNLPVGCNPTSNTTVQHYEGTYCDYDTIENRDCTKLKSCSECLASFPAHPDAMSHCQWCDGCSRCQPRGQECDFQDPYCQSSPYVTAVEDCPLLCQASDCPKCTNMSDCIWTVEDIYTDDRDTAHCTVLPVVTGDIFAMPPEQCPLSCYTHTSCSTCLSSSGPENGWQECVWSDDLNQCMSPTFVALQCANGVCGHIVRFTDEGCHQPCSRNTMCSTCLRQPGCGWCSLAGQNGVGVCMEGGLHGPAYGGVCSVGDVSLGVQPLPAGVANYTTNLLGPPSWSFDRCPPENECLNGHHDCAIHEQCNDTDEYFHCNCKQGYKRELATNMCIPVCTHGCIHGNCIAPDNCECLFSYVGVNCSIECECNGHSTCPSVELKHECTMCMDNTTGTNCEVCQPFFVGDPKNNGDCTSCRDYCNQNSDICMTQGNVNVTLHKYSHLSESQITQAMALTVSSIGPLSNAVCLGCENHSEGTKCETCQDGYFLYNGICTLCQCNGHWHTCDKLSGRDCDCQNNTETVCSGNDDDKPCWQRQCASCKELYVGTPTEGHQCYRQMQYDNEFCFDPDTQTNCQRSPKPLLPGRTMFFAVQPKYTNVDIRLTVDITVGIMDVYLSYLDNTWVIDVNNSTGVHSVRIDHAQMWEHSRKKRSIDPSSSRYSRNTQPLPQETTTTTTASPTEESIVNELLEIHATQLNTFVTLHNPYTFLIINNLQNRLVVTLPHMNHELKIRKFYIILLSKGDSFNNETYGILYFRQDQPHIDLFVFFSVFFSCFFLFLALCVVIWKVKLFFDARQDRRRRAVEMENMASRPFAKVLVFVDPVKPLISPILPNRRPNNRLPKLPRRGHEPSSRPRSPHPSDVFKIHPLAIEPVDDGIAAVSTVMFALPGGSSAPLRGCLGSALVSLKSQNRLTEIRPPVRQKPPPPPHQRLHPPPAVIVYEELHVLLPNSDRASAVTWV